MFWQKSSLISCAGFWGKGGNQRKKFRRKSLPKTFRESHVLRKKNNSVVRQKSTDGAFSLRPKYWKFLPNCRKTREVVGPQPKSCVWEKESPHCTGAKIRRFEPVNEELNDPENHKYSQQPKIANFSSFFRKKLSQKCRIRIKIQCVIEKSLLPKPGQNSGELDMGKHKTYNQKIIVKVARSSSIFIRRLSKNCRTTTKFIVFDRAESPR